MAFTTITKSTDYFETLKYSNAGDGAKAVTGLDFTPDWVWLKALSANMYHQSHDSVKGASAGPLYPNDPAAIDTGYPLSSFDSGGFTTGAQSGNEGQNSASHVAWCWRAGTTGSGTTGGSGTSKSYNYSVNTTSGLSIIKYEGNGTNNHQIPHHLGVAPKMIIFKNFQSGYSWDTYHHNIGNAHRLYLDSSVIKQSATNFLNSTTPTSTYINLGDAGHTNHNGTNHIAYCFADVTGYQKCGFYVGNGNSDGPTIITNFKPAMVFFKRTEGGAANWQMWDNKRDTYNPVEKALHPDIANQSSNDQDIDFLSNGFKIRSNQNHLNASGNKFIYYAVAEAPIVGTNNVPAVAR